MTISSVQNVKVNQPISDPSTLFFTDIYVFHNLSERASVEMTARLVTQTRCIGKSKCLHSVAIVTSIKYIIHQSLMLYGIFSNG